MRNKWRPARRLKRVPAVVPTSGLRSLARGYAEAARAPSTRALYRYDFRAFVAWCEARGFKSLPATPDTVTLYMTFRAESGWKALTIARELTSISQAHKTAGYPSPRSALLVQQVLKGRGPLFREVPSFGPIGSEPLSGLAIARVVSERPEPSGWIPSGFPGTRSARASRRRLPRPASPSARS